MSGWERAKHASKRARERRFAALQLRRKQLQRWMLHKWAESVRQAKRDRQFAEWERQAQNELESLRKVKDAQLDDAAETMSALRLELTHSQDALQGLRDRVRNLLAHGFHAVGASAAHAVETSLGIVDSGHDASPRGDAANPSTEGAMGLLRMLLDAEVDGRRRATKDSRLRRSTGHGASRKSGPASSSGRLDSTWGTAGRSQATRSELPGSARSRPASSGFASRVHSGGQRRHRAGERLMASRLLERFPAGAGALDTSFSDGADSAPMPLTPPRAFPEVGMMRTSARGVDSKGGAHC